MCEKLAPKKSRRQRVKPQEVGPDSQLPGEGEREEMSLTAGDDTTETVKSGQAEVRAKLSDGVERAAQEYEKTAVKILQLNLIRSQRVLDLLWAHAVEEGAGFLVVSEIPARYQESRWQFRDEDCAAGIIVVDKRIGLRESGCGKGFVWIRGEWGTLFSVYISPNSGIPVLEGFLDGIKSSVRSCRGKVVIAGDFNAKAPDWGSPITDARGEAVRAWAAELDLVAGNDGSPTFQRGETRSHLDLTWANQDAARFITGWRVIDGESLSDHLTISFELVEARQGDSHARELRLRDPSDESLKRELRGVQQTADPMVLAAAIARASERARGNNRRRRPVYWWNEEVASARTSCIAARRRATRGRGGNEAPLLRSCYQSAKRELRTCIKRAKQEAWKRLCKSIDDNPWGNAYKIALRRVGKGRAGSCSLSSQETTEVVRMLFPSHQVCDWEVEESPPPSDLTTEEVRSAVEAIKTRTAPGPDGIAGSTLKKAWVLAPAVVLRCLNSCWKRGEFPKPWKTAELVLIPKGGADRTATAWRPICLLDELGKALERVVRNRLEGEVEDTGGLSDAQFGFTKGKATVHAANRIIERARQAGTGSRHTRQLVAVVAVDVRNAFNSVPWSAVMGALRRRGISASMRRMIGSYLSDRWLSVRGGQILPVTAGVPQGSILGPTLWNILYDELLKTEMPYGVELVAYADDVAVMAVAKRQQILAKSTNEALGRIVAWMRARGLQIAAHKTEAILLIGRRHCGDIRFRVDDATVRPVTRLKYLGIWLDQRMSFGDHIREAAQKAGNVARALAWILPNVNGPRTSRRKLLASVVMSTMLYGAEVWGEAVACARYRRMLEGVQRAIALRVVEAYRTVSLGAAQVLAGLLPVDLQASARRKSFLAGRTAPTKTEMRRQSMTSWQERWAAAPSWTGSLIPIIEPWVNRRHGDLNHWLSQFLTGHGEFGSFLFRIGKRERAIGVTGAVLWTLRLTRCFIVRVETVLGWMFFPKPDRRASRFPKLFPTCLPVRKTGKQPAER